MPARPIRAPTAWQADHAATDDKESGWEPRIVRSTQANVSGWSSGQAEMRADSVGDPEHRRGGNATLRSARRISAWQADHAATDDKESG